MTSTALGYAFIGGILPPLLWLYFLLKEDSRSPEPKHIIALAFIAGMLAVPFALPIEQWGCARLALIPGAACTSSQYNLSVITFWALTEEMLKYIMAALFILWRRAVDETPDYVIYMITVALGFASAENILFLLAPLSEGQLSAGLMTSNLRFLGATLLHVTASAAIGFAFAFSARFSPPIRAAASALGLILAIALHTAFNMLIINQGTSAALSAFFLVWTSAVIVIAMFEILKYFQYRDLPTNTN